MQKFLSVRRPLLFVAALVLVAVSPPNTQSAARAALSIGQSREISGAKRLENHTKDPRISVRALSVYGLGLIGLREDVPVVLDATGDASSAVRLAALDGVGRYEDAGTLDAGAEASAQSRTSRLLRADPDPYVRARAALTLAAFSNSPRAADALKDLESAATSGPAMVREHAWWSIFRKYAKRASRAFLRAGLTDPDDVVRIQAVRAYGHLTGTAAALDLEPLLHDPSWRVQEQAAESIRVLRGGAMTDHLTELTENIHIPTPAPDPLADLPALPRPHTHRGAPTANDVPSAPQLDPQTAQQMVSPAHGLHPRLRFRTSEGNIYIVLYPEWAPHTVANFLNLTNRGFYDNNRWFRIVPDFVVQTGEQDDKKAPGPGYAINAEQNPLEQTSYIISMGLDYAGTKPKLDSAGSEYYITLSPQYHLNGPFTVFGAVTSGFDVLARLTEHDRVIRIDRIKDVML
jgi:peptidyl-prolyl cis-trans isomerase B (cyclophilin B)